MRQTHQLCIDQQSPEPWQATEVRTACHCHSGQWQDSHCALWRDLQDPL